MAKVRIGTSGWVYKHWQGMFYPDNLTQTKWLSFYSENFGTVEVNSSFYHQVLPKTYENWSKNVPENFIFSLKANRFITHIKRLKDPKESLKNFFESAKFLENKLGPILFQLPPRWKADKERLKLFLSTSNKLRSTAVVGSQKSVTRLAFEFRDQSWLEESIFEILKKNNCALVIQDSPDWPSVEMITADFVYLRFHGSQSLYSSNYTAEELKGWAEKIKKWRKVGLDVYSYFNNDANVYAVENAKTLAEMVNF